MSNRDNEARVRASALAAELNDEQIGALAALVETHELTEGEILIEQGTRDDRMFLLVRGALVVCRRSEDNQSWINLHRLAPGEIVGELAFLENLERTASVRATQDTEVVSLRRSKLESVLESDPLLVYRIMRAILRSVHRVVSHLNAQHAHLVDYVMR